MLIDCRLSPQKLDLEFLHWMVEGGLPFVLVFTKADKLTDKAAQKNIECFLGAMKDISEDRPEIVLSSSMKGQGRDEILDLIASTLAAAPEDPA